MPDLDPCIEAAELRALRRDIVTGRAISQTRFGDDFVSYVKADMARLDSLIADAERECAIQTGKPIKPRRQARGVRFRPY